MALGQSLWALPFSCIGCRVGSSCKGVPVIILYCHVWCRRAVCRLVYTHMWHCKPNVRWTTNTFERTKYTLSSMLMQKPPVEICNTSASMALQSLRSPWGAVGWVIPRYTWTQDHREAVTIELSEKGNCKRRRGEVKVGGGRGEMLHIRNAQSSHPSSIWRPIYGVKSTHVPWFNIWVG